VPPIDRSLLTLLLALTLPFTAWAGVALPAQPCPMQAMMVATVSATAQAEGKMDCCADAATAAKTGKPCKVGQECPSGTQAQPVVAIAAAPVLNTSPRIPTAQPFAASTGPTGVWRPPISV